MLPVLLLVTFLIPRKVQYSFTLEPIHYHYFSFLYITSFHLCCVITNICIYPLYFKSRYTNYLSNTSCWMWDHAQVSSFIWTEQVSISMIHPNIPSPCCHSNLSNSVLTFPHLSWPVSSCLSVPVRTPKPVPQEGKNGFILLATRNTPF